MYISLAMHKVTRLQQLFNVAKHELLANRLVISLPQDIPKTAAIALGHNDVSVTPRLGLDIRGNLGSL